MCMHDFAAMLTHAGAASVTTLSQQVIVWQVCKVWRVCFLKCRSARFSVGCSPEPLNAVDRLTDEDPVLGQLPLHSRLQGAPGHLLTCRTCTGPYSALRIVQILCICQHGCFVTVLGPLLARIASMRPTVVQQAGRRSKAR